jgi:hypothetical protein
MGWALAKPINSDSPPTMGFASAFTDFTVPAHKSLNPSYVNA